MDSYRDKDYKRFQQLSIPYIKTSYKQRLREIIETDPDQLSPFLMGYDFDYQRLIKLINTNRNNDDDPSIQKTTVVRCQTYSSRELSNALERTFNSLNLLETFGKLERILIKVGLVQAVRPEQHVTTHPPFLFELIRKFRAYFPKSEILVADGAGHERDTAYLLSQTGIGEVIDSFDRCHYVDLNVQDVVTKPVSGGYVFDAILSPKILDEVDIVVSLAKQKTHHWAGVSLCMKNLFGIMPGSVYGYPKNQLHWAGIPRVIADIYRTCTPDLNIIDGIKAVEGNGPLNGNVRTGTGILASTNALHCDVTSSILMGFSPYLIPQFWYTFLDEDHEIQQVDVGNSFFQPPPNFHWLYKSSRMTAQEIQVTLSNIEGLLV